LWTKCNPGKSVYAKNVNSIAQRKQWEGFKMFEYAWEALGGMLLPVCREGIWKQHYGFYVCGGCLGEYSDGFARSEAVTKNRRRSHVGLQFQ